MRLHSALEREHFPADHEHIHQGEREDPKRRCYVDAKIGPLRNAQAALMMAIGSRMMKKLTVK